MQGFDLRHRSRLDPLIQFVGRGTVRGVLYDLGAYPAFLPGEGTVKGELYAMIDPATLLSRVDAIEGYDPDDFTGSRYVRHAIRVMPSRGPIVSAWLYVFNRGVGDGAWIPSGDYAARAARRTAGGQRINEVGDRAGRRFAEIDELDTRSVKHLLAMKRADRGMDDAALDDNGASPQRQAKIVQRADRKRRGRIDLCSGGRDLRDPHRLDNGDAPREVIVDVDPRSIAPFPGHVARL